MKKIHTKNIFSNHSPKFIFVHIPKTAGTSIQKWIHDGTNTNVDTNIQWNGNSVINTHKTAQEYIDELGDKFYKHYSFSIIRNPWERMFSFYRYIIQFHGVTVNTFEEFLFKPHNWTPTIMQQQTDFCNDSAGNQLVNFVGRFETLQTDIEIIGRNIHLPALELTHENVSKKKDYRTVYTTAMVERVAEMVPTDVTTLNYEFE